MAPSHFASLLAEIRACTICADVLEHDPRPVVQVHPDARILIAGQAPGRLVHESGVPFDDPSGVRLRKWMGVDVESFYDARKIAIVPMGFCFPGSGKSGDLPPRPECAPAWRQSLLAELNSIEFTLILGRYAQDYHLPEIPKTVTEAVADWKSNWPHAVALPHPSPRNQRWFKRNPWFEAEVVPKIQSRIAGLLAE